MLILQKATALGRIIFYKTLRNKIWRHKKVSMR